MSMDSEQNTLGSGISYSARLPFAWSPAEDSNSLLRAEENEKTLRTIIALEEHPPEHSEEFAALDFKMNIVLELMSDLLAHQMNLPATTEVDFSASRLMWRSMDGALPEPGQCIDVSLFLHRTFPRPLVLRGVVERVDVGICYMHIDEQPEIVQELVDKFLFAHHRRQVAQSRHSDH